MESDGAGWAPVDVVALVLAAALVVLVCGLVAALLLTLVEHRNPPGLGENTAQILIAVLGGLVGILGAYVGLARGSRDADTRRRPVPGPPPPDH